MHIRSILRVRYVGTHLRASVFENHRRSQSARVVKHDSLLLLVSRLCCSRRELSSCLFFHFFFFYRSNGRFRFICITLTRSINTRSNRANVYIIIIIVSYVDTPAVEPLEYNVPAILYDNVGTVKRINIGRFHRDVNYLKPSALSRSA